MDFCLMTCYNWQCQYSIGTANEKYIENLIQTVRNHPVYKQNYGPGPYAPFVLMGICMSAGSFFHCQYQTRSRKLCEGGNRFMKTDLLTRYSEITEKNRREIVLLRGSGCKWRRCAFCDYHLDFNLDEDSNFALNQEVLRQVTGKYGRLEVINSGSFVDLDDRTVKQILDICIGKKITEIHFESHWMHRDAAAALRKTFAAHGIQVKLKIGVETFDAPYREQILHKGIDETSPEKIAACFDEVCLLFGLDGQTKDSMQHDIETGLANFERVCINIMVENTTPVLPNRSVIDIFMKELYPVYKADQRIDILLDNTDFGVG